MTDIRHDQLYNNFINDKRELSPVTLERYTVTLTKFSKCVNTDLTTIIEDCKREQNKVIEKIVHSGTDEDGNEIIEKIVTRFDINDPNSSIKKYLNQFIDCAKQRGNKNTTINNEIRVLKTFLNHFGVILPKVEKFEDDSDKWYLLEKEDFKYIISDSTITHSSLIKFLQSSGMRIKDATSLTIGDFMEATSEYHNFVDVNEFIDNAPEDMIGSWYFNPNKTIKYNIFCQTFNDPESSNLILQNLRRIKNQYYPRKNKEFGLDLKVSKSDALFGSKTTYFKESMSVRSASALFWWKNKKLREWRILKIKEAIKNGEIAAEDYEREVAKIPKFHAHACRKYFETIIARNCGNLRICTLMEGHVSPVKTDSSYIKQDIEEVKEYYLAAIPDLSLENTEVKIYSSEIREEMENKIDSLRKENEEYKKKVDFLVEEISDIKKLYH